MRLTAEQIKEILQLHCAGKKHSWIAYRYGILPSDVRKIVLSYAEKTKGTEIRPFNEIVEEIRSEMAEKVEFYCTKCRKKVKVPEDEVWEEVRGRVILLRAKCPKCGWVILSRIKGRAPLEVKRTPLFGGLLDEIIGVK